MKVDPFIEAEEARRSQRQNALSPARGLPVRLLRAQEGRPLGPRLSPTPS